MPFWVAKRAHAGVWDQSSLSLPHWITKRIINRKGCELVQYLETAKPGIDNLGASLVSTGITILDGERSVQMMVDSDSSVSQKTAQPPEQSLNKITVRTLRIVWCKEKDSLLLDLYAHSMPEKVGYVKRFMPLGQKSTLT